MIWEVLVLGFVLSLDNFRISIALGTVPFGLKRAVQVGDGAIAADEQASPAQRADAAKHDTQV